MPNITSAKKRVRSISRKTMRNKMVKSNVRTLVKNAVVALKNGSENCEDAVKIAIKKLDQAGAKGVFHKNKVANKKSQLQKLFNASRV